MAMALRSAGRNLSYEILSQSSSIEDDETLFHRSNSDPFHNHSVPNPNRKRRKKRKKKTATNTNTITTSTTTIEIQSSIPEEPINGNDREAEADSSVLDNFGIAEQKFQVSGNGDSYCSSNGFESNYEGFSVTPAKFVRSGSGGSVCTVTEQQPGFQNVRGELRQRTVNGSGGGAGDGGLEDSASRVYSEGKVETDVEVNSAGKQRTEPNGVVLTKLETAESLDWKKLMAEDPNYMFSSEKSPFKYFLDDMLSGNSLRRTTTFGNEKERERVYDTIFRLPWRCELLINVGFFVCFDSFLSLLTIMPTRILTTMWRFIKTRQFKRPSAAELSDFGCFVIMVCGVILLERTDISLIYHMIRGQGTIKLYVVYNVLEIFDKLCQSFNGDVLQTLFNSADGLAISPPDNITFWIWRYMCDLTLAVAASNILTFVFNHFLKSFSQAITLSTCIVAHNNALLALLVSNNFSEIKSNVFKRYSRENIHSLVYFDSVERFHISAFVLFVLAQNILEAEGPWFESFLSNALLVYVCEMAIDIIKHSFIAKFNDIKPIAYSEFLEDLCKQILHMDLEDSKNILTFIPLAPACVVIRVLTPVYAACLPCHPFPWKLFWIVLLFSVNFVMLTSLKIGCNLVIKKKKKKTDWLNTLLRLKFFDTCVHHEEYRKNEKNLFCIDCNIGFCRHCVTSHCLHRRLQICKYVYHNVVRLQDIQKHLDCSKIQTYKINGEKAVHLNPRPQSKDAKPSTKSLCAGSCEACNRYIQDPPNRFCSISCKITIVPLKPKESSNFITYEDLSCKEKSINSETMLSEIESSLSLAESSEEIQPCWVNSSLKPRKLLHKRKGIPFRAPLY
ncbi:hypothetical protein F8388_018604 [Cannabis sativa]|uniref:B box-type domain-containing protein n=1 Tax=Cannabis sativa TaxID=3483 RepID=A0A7J6FFD5_CANSA|nr:hypothetical protein F8388_018604 [Cannabis sativa]